MILGTINCQKLSLNSTDIVADTIDFIEARFVFLSDDWDGLEKWAHFARDSAVYDIRLTDDHIRKEDHLNLSAGKWKVYIHGNEFRGGEVVQRVTTNMVTLYVEPTGTLDGEPFPEIPASVTEQILARLEDVEQNGGGGGDGYSPEAKVERVEGGVRVTITDKDGTTSEVVQDGKPGVHVGNDAPPAGTRVWVNPNGKRTEIPQVDDTLTKAGYAADAAAVGEALKKQSNAIADLGVTAPRAQVRQVFCKTADDDSGVNFADVYCPADWSYSTYAEQYLREVFGLEAHKTSSTAQRVFQSLDGGDTWSEYASLPMDAANGVWYTDFVVDSDMNAIYALKTTDGGAMNNNAVSSFYLWSGDGKWHERTSEISLGAKRWLSNNSFEIFRSPDKTKRVAIFGEYGTTMDGTTYSLWRTTNGGATWAKVLEIVGDDNTSGTMVRGEIRHWHTVKADPHTGHVWAAAGDTDAQCKIYRSTDGGENWEIMFSGSQRERTCGFVFEEDCIYYGMDAKHGTDPNFTRIIKIDKSKLDTDRENAREDVAVVDSCRSVYGLTRTFYPDGFIVWSQQEPDSEFKTDSYTLQFFDYATKKLYPVAHFDISNISTTKYIGFYAGAKCQLLTNGVIFAKPTNSMHQERYGFNFVSRYIKINLTM